MLVNLEISILYWYLDTVPLQIQYRSLCGLVKFDLLVFSYAMIMCDISIVSCWPTRYEPVLLS